MKVQPRWRSHYVTHAAWVALVATVIIGAMYVLVGAGLDGADRHRLVAQLDQRLDERLSEIANQPSAPGAIDNYANSHDVDDAPVFLWSVAESGSRRELVPGTPRLSAGEWSPTDQSAAARLGTANFVLQSRRVGNTWFVVGQSLATADRVRSDLLALEVIAGPLLLLAVFLGTLLIGIKAASPVELARRRQLEFTADASHELRTPLSVIEAEVSLALDGHRRVEDYRTTLERVSRESLRLRDIVEDLLWLSRFDSQPPPPGDMPVDVSAVAATCVDRFAVVAQRRGIALSVHTRGDGQPWINAPPEWVDRLIGVLVDNACRYAGHDGAVEIAVTTTGSRVVLAVDDSGPGIAPEERAKLFDRFHRATDEGNGAGLGLAIADSVVRATGGEWQIGQAHLGGVRMEIRWHGSPSARELGEHRNQRRHFVPKHDDSPVVR